MTRNWQLLRALAVLLAYTAVCPCGFRSAGGTAASAADAGPRKESPSDYVWTLQYRIWTKPGDERVSAHGIEQDIRCYYTAVVRNIHVRPDGTFRFDACDFGVMRIETDQLDKQGKSEFHSVLQGQGLLRGTGKWEGGGKSLDEPIQLRMAFASGNGESVTTAADGKVTNTTRFSASPDGRTQTNPGQTIQGKLSDLEYPNTWQPSNWTLRPPPDAPAKADRIGWTRRVPFIPAPSALAAVSLLAADCDECDEREQQRSDQRDRTDPCLGGVPLPLLESVYMTGEKKEADVRVSLGGSFFQASPGGSGSVEAIVSNDGPCDTFVVLVVVMTAGQVARDGWKEWIKEHKGADLRVLAYPQDAKGEWERESHGYQRYQFVTSFPLPCHGQKTVTFQVQDTTPPQERKSNSACRLSFYARAPSGPPPDPDCSNNVTRRDAIYGASK